MYDKIGEFDEIGTQGKYNFKIHIFQKWFFGFLEEVIKVFFGFLEEIIIY